MALVRRLTAAPTSMLRPYKGRNVVERSFDDHKQ
jgi:hypothetical protein